MWRTQEDVGAHFKFERQGVVAWRATVGHSDRSVTESQVEFVRISDCETKSSAPCTNSV